MPEAERTAPPVAAELSQPRPSPLGGFEQLLRQVFSENVFRAAHHHRPLDVVFVHPLQQPVDGERARVVPALAQVGVDVDEPDGRLVLVAAGPRRPRQCHSRRRGAEGAPRHRHTRLVHFTPIT